jgi:hypothetical protein
MRKILLILFAACLTGCVNEQVIISKGSPAYPAGTVYPDNILKNWYRNKAPYFAKDGLPNSELQVKAYKSAIRDVAQGGHWFGGFFFGMSYAISTSFFNAQPPVYDFASIPPDSVYWFSRYYQNEVKQIRSTNAWWGWGTRMFVAILSESIYLLTLNNTLK